MGEQTGLYVMRVASMLLGMHPQTLHKYERVGLISPARSRTLRRYSDEDIARLRIIKYLVNEMGLNLAGVELALSLRAKLLQLGGLISTMEASEVTPRQLQEAINDMLNDMLNLLGPGVSSTSALSPTVQPYNPQTDNERR